MGRIGAFLIWMLLSTCDGRHPTVGPRSGVVHLTRHEDAVQHWDGPAGWDYTNPTLEFDEIPPVHRSDGIGWSLLPWPAETGTLEVHGAGNRRLEPIDPDALLGGAEGFLYLAPERRVAATELIRHGGKTRKERRGTTFEPAHFESTTADAWVAWNCLWYHAEGEWSALVQSVDGEPMTLRLQSDGGRSSHEMALTGQGWELVEQRLRLPPGPRRLRLSAADSTPSPESEGTARPFRVAWMRLRSGVPVLAARPAEAPRVKYRARAPRVRERRFVDPSEEQVIRWRTLGSDVTIRSVTPDLHVRPAASDDPRWLDIECDGKAGWIEVEQPAVRLLAQATHPTRRWDGTETRVAGEGHALRARMELRGERRTGFWLPTDSELELNLEADSPRLLRFAAGIPEDPHLPPAEELERALRGVSSEDREATLRVLWRGAGPTFELVDEISLREGEGWAERQVQLPEGTADGTLRFESTGAPGTPVGVAEPRLVPGGDAPPAQPNVILYLVDTLRADHLSSYGSRHTTTPHLDRLAEDGFRFDRFYAIASWTRPTTATLFTGAWPAWHLTGRDRPLPLRFTTLAESLEGAGYSTWAAVSNPQVSASGLQFEQGFQRFVTHERVGENGEQATSTQIQSVLQPWLHEFKDEPFFLFLHSLDPHTPYAPPEDAERPYGQDYEGILQGEPLRRFRILQLQERLGASDRQYIEDMYDNEIQHQDVEIGRLVETLETEGLLERTILILVSDHGDEFYEHGDWNHGYRMWEELLRVPLIVWIPPEIRRLRGLTPRVIDATLSQVDFLPGFLDLLGIEDPEPRQGTSWLPLLRGEPVEFAPYIGQDYQCWEGSEIGAFRSGSYKLIWNLDDAGNVLTERLYDLATDPGEQHDLAAAEPDRLASVRQERDEFLANTTRAWPLPAASGSAARDTLDAEALRQLEALGYVTDR